MPTVAVEAGYSESSDDLLDDLNVLLVGANGDINCTITVKWRKLAGGRVAGVAKLYVRDANGIPIPRQTEVCSRYLINIAYAYYLNFV
jgi:hypothetical protein